MMKRRVLSLVMAFASILMVLLGGCAAQPTEGEPPVMRQRTESAQQPAEDAAAESAVTVTCLDVGKGDCILVQAGESAVLIDTGYQNTSDEVCSYLEEQGVNHLDALILTHYDRDHVGGLSGIAGSVRTDTVFLPSYAGADKHFKTTISAIKKLGLTSQLVTETLLLELGAARLEIYPSGVAYVSDANGDEGNDNDASLVIALTNGSDSYLFAGDLEDEGIEAYLRESHGQFDVLKLPHHGESCGNTSDFLDDVQPKIVLITDDKSEPADKKTLKLFKKREVDVYRTSTDGTIVIESVGKGNYQVTTSKM